MLGLVIQCSFGFLVVFAKANVPFGYIYVFLCCRHELFFKTCHIMPIIIGQKCVLIQLYSPMLSFLQPVFRLLKNIFPLILYPVPHICWSQQGKKQVRRINIQRVSLSRLKQQASRKVNYSLSCFVMV